MVHFYVGVSKDNGWMSLFSWDVTGSLEAMRMYQQFGVNCCLNLLFPEDWGSIFLRNAGTCLPKDRCHVPERSNFLTANSCYCHVIEEET